MIKKFSAENYGCLKKVEAELTPLHAFIGPNDSGKSTLLHAMRTLVQFAGSSFSFGVDRTPQPFDPWLSTKQGAVETFLGAYTEAGWYAIRCGERGTEESAQDEPTGELGFASERFWNEPSRLQRPQPEPIHAILAGLRHARLLRLDPDALREPSTLIPESELVSFLDERGRGLPGVYYAILSRGDDAFQRIASSVREHFPVVRNLRVPALSRDQLVLEVELQDGTRVRANRMSEGLLYYLAFAALRYLEPASLTLIEEPENGLHPARIAEVIKMLRAFVEETGTQIIMATHSPLVVNELQPDEVTLVTRPSLEEGTKLTPIRETPNFDKRRSVYELGELWLAYADGVQEAPLFDVRRR